MWIKYNKVIKIVKVFGGYAVSGRTIEKNVKVAYDEGSK